MSAAEHVLGDLTATLSRAVGAGLLGLYVHGSLVAGDFAPDRSDLDVFAVLSADPDDARLRQLRALHAGLDHRHPRWAGRIEVEYVSLDALRDGPPAPVTAGPSPGRTSPAGTSPDGTSPDGTSPGGPGHLMARTSPGEPIHLMPVTSHRAVTWAAVREYGRALHGPAPDVLLPPVDPAVVRAALLDHVRDWPAWVLDMTAPGAQAYSVLTVCRAEQRLGYGRQLSKRAAADATAAVRPDDAALIVWARDWWYDGGADIDPGRFDEVRAFVNRLSASIRARTYPRRTSAS